MPTLGDLIAGAAQRYGQPSADLLREAQIESSMDPSAHNASGAAGLFQFMPGTARAYGLANPYDPAASADAAARLMRDNTAFLARNLGRPPTPGEVYLAHQQGAAGALAILSNPSAPANAAAAANGGAGMTNGQFAAMWSRKFSGAQPGAGANGDAGSASLPGDPTLADALSVAMRPVPTSAAAMPAPAAYLGAPDQSMLDQASAAQQQAADQQRRAALIRVAQNALSG